jgi:hypothetical protein
MLGSRVRGSRCIDQHTFNVCCTMYIINIVVDMKDDVYGIETQDDWVELS